ncbi:hypothetical protein M501DRAFT_535763 [Patellaria atrata CBS 101060]|uniref:Uncharacterized protein n=1 Tax=Patellaria atrata CBS 101060 TaxID=1346257 RepID=A0A9P4SGE0_9PEZI|nr:hypothetical protein M501DRAFT_535763 [Patellaria atrata CBS 101060]
MRHKIQILSNSPSLLSHGVALVPRDTPNPPQPRTIDNRDYDKVLALTAIVRGNGLVRVLRGSTDGEKEVSFLFRKMVHNFDKGSERSKRGGEMDEEEGDWGGDGGEVDEEEVEREEEDTPREDLVDEDADEEDLGLDDTAFYSDGFEEEQRDEADEDEVDEDDDEDDDEIYYNTENRVENEGVEEYESEGFEDGGLDPGTMGNTEYA